MLITAAPARRAASIWRAESEQRMRDGSATFSARAPGHTPRLPTPLAAAAATAAVAVPWKSVSGWPPVVATLPDWNSGWVMSSWESTSAISGLVGVTGGGTSAGSTMRARQGEAARERVRRGRLRARGVAVGLGVAEQARRAQVGGERARAGAARCARRRRRCAGRRGRGRSARPRGRAARRRSSPPGRPARPRRRRRRAARRRRAVGRRGARRRRTWGRRTPRRGRRAPRAGSEPSPGLA